MVHVLQSVSLGGRRVYRGLVSILRVQSILTCSRAIVWRAELIYPSLSYLLGHKHLLLRLLLILVSLIDELDLLIGVHLPTLCIPTKLSHPVLIGMVMCHVSISCIHVMDHVDLVL
jgi:hypothetical protein